MREGRNERTYTTTKHITTLLLRSRVKKITYFTRTIGEIWNNITKILAEFSVNLQHSFTQFYLQISKDNLHLKTAMHLFIDTNTNWYIIFTTYKMRL